MGLMMVSLSQTSYPKHLTRIMSITRSFYKFSSLKRGHFFITGLRPMRGTHSENEPMVSSVEIAKAGAIARLIPENVTSHSVV